MKPVSVILLIIITGSILVPCADAENDFSARQEIFFTQDADHGDQADFDFCPPLCSCHCCHSHITAAGSLAYLLPTQPFQELSSYYSDHLSRISFSIWQPPKTA